MQPIGPPSDTSSQPSIALGAQENEDRIEGSWVAPVARKEPWRIDSGRAMAWTIESIREAAVEPAAVFALAGP